MPSLQIRKLPPHIYEALKQLAQQEKRSLSQQAVISLAEGLKVQLDQRAHRKNVLERIRQRAPRYKEFSLELITEWIRTDRDNR